MRYVIQNYNLLAKSIVLTPRLRFLLIINYLFFFYFFYKNYYYFISFKVNHAMLYYNFFVIWYKYLYCKQMFKFFKKVNFDYVGFYLNNVIKSYVFFFFVIFNKFLDNNKLPLFRLLTSISYKIKPKYLYQNSIIFSHKTAVFKLNKTFYKSFFFFLMLFSVTIWMQYTNFFKFYLNFLIINPNLQISTSYKGFFFSIFNF